MRSYLPPVEFLRECLDYNPETGVFRWRWRPDEHFQTLRAANIWNSRQAGAVAFALGNRGYMRAEVVYKGRRLGVQAGRVAYKLLTGEEPMVVDHIDGNPANNRASNLRATDNHGNAWNRHKDRQNGLPRGAIYYKKWRRWVALVSEGAGKNRRSTYLGSFATAEEAHKAWRAYTEPRRGEFFNAGANRSGIFE